MLEGTADDVALTSTTAPDTVFAGVNGTTTAASSGVTADLSMAIIVI